MRTLCLALLAAAIGGGACAASPEPDPQAFLARPDVNFAKLGHTYWRVTDPWAAADAMLIFDQDTVSYYGPCGAVSFSYRQNVGGDFILDVAPYWQVRGSCFSDPPVEFLHVYYALRQANSAKEVDDGAILAWVANSLAHLKRFEPAGLEYRRWAIVKYFDGIALKEPELQMPNWSRAGGPPVRLPPPNVSFDHDALEGSPGCGGLGGDYKLDGGALAIRPISMLGGACPPNLTAEDDRVLAALKRVRRAEPAGSQMLLRGDKGEVEVILVAEP